MTPPARRPPRKSYATRRAVADAPADEIELGVIPYIGDSQAVVEEVDITSLVRVGPQAHVADALPQHTAAAVAALLAQAELSRGT